MHEVAQLLSDGARLMDISDRFAAMMEQLPAQVTEECSSAIDQLSRQSEMLIGGC